MEPGDARADRAKGLAGLARLSCAAPLRTRRGGRRPRRPAGRVGGDRAAADHRTAGGAMAGVPALPVVAAAGSDAGIPGHQAAGISRAMDRLSRLLALTALLVFGAAARAQEPLATLEVISEPAGAMVEIDGRVVGTTPIRVSVIPAADIDVLVRADGFAPASETLTLTGAGVARMSFVLDPADPEIVVNVLED